MINDRYTWITVVLTLAAFGVPMVVFNTPWLVNLTWGFVCGYYVPGVAALLRCQFAGKSL
jgi:hypothetical protein